ncbi:uncharacterized protein APUU_20355S [Aspergillus puulaauensis]|uniref:ChrR-like cupin domain-containing protein n=1 Tax=Aspergillus puulaauensis TaxID=1220207 RepID=A0A7R7XF71_9EURO|nr:uncharacterized protein APUU_20355S [Aspergillus puulaauensis]BCS19923.1 hypothetical protein APUU_20355S [Aspergillus puulaauensis]
MCSSSSSSYALSVLSNVNQALYPKTMHSQEDAGHTVHVADLKWLPLVPSIWIKVIKLVPETGEYTIMVRAEPGGMLPRHRHVESAEIYVLKGSGAHPQAGAFVAGDYVSESKGAVHDPLPFHCETELLMVSRGPSAFLADDGEDMYMMDVDMLQALAKAAETAV